MRISDWSSDVCSSDLDAVVEQGRVVLGQALAVEAAGSDGGIGGVRATGPLERGDGNAAHQQRGTGNGAGVLVQSPLLMAHVLLLCARQFSPPLPDTRFHATAYTYLHDDSTTPTL